MEKGRVIYRMNDKSGLILEGGGMRGAFTSGVLDNFMDRGIRFPYTIGVSAGACNGLSYMSGQRGRAKFSNIDLLERYHYIGLRHLIRKGNIMDFDLLFDDFPNRIIPYDYKSFRECAEQFVMVTTSCLTGEARYLSEKCDSGRIIDIVKASSSLPFVSPICYVDGEPMLDGGISDSIPLQHTMEEGYTNCVVVLTRNRGYRKSDSNVWVPPFFYSRYPHLREAIRQRNERYNQTIEMVERLEDRGDIVVIRPERPIEVGRMERDTKRLLALYNEGYECAASVDFEL